MRRTSLMRMGEARDTRATGAKAMAEGTASAAMIDLVNMMKVGAETTEGYVRVC